LRMADIRKTYVYKNSVRSKLVEFGSYQWDAVKGEIFDMAIASFIKKDNVILTLSCIENQNLYVELKEQARIPTDEEWSLIRAQYIETQKQKQQQNIMLSSTIKARIMTSKTCPFCTKKKTFTQYGLENHVRDVHVSRNFWPLGHVQQSTPFK
jgi:hypothetical protein